MDGGVNEVTGLFTFQMKVNGEPRPALAQIIEPGLPPEKVVHVVRGEWANLVAPGVSQNRIECLGWEKAEAAPEGWVPVKKTGANPVIVWRPAAS